MDEAERARGEQILEGEAQRVLSKIRFLNARRADPEAQVTPEDCGIDPDQDWKAQLIGRVDQKTGETTVLCRVHNLMLILEHDPKWAGRLRLDQLRQGVALDDADLEDRHLIEIKADLERRWIASEVKTAVVREAVETVAAHHAYHPVQEWLYALMWDGTERIPTFFSDYCGATLTPYTRAVALSLFISAVARVFQPGCKVDTMVVLEGAQGIGKSKLVQALFGPRWHCDITQEPGTLDFYQNLRGKWCGEFSELSAMGRADQNKVKQALTQTQDTYRASYGHYSRTYPRQFVFIGNTNRGEYLGDETGARRYLPIECIEIDAEEAGHQREQLWAEALHRFRTGEKWWDIPDATKEQEARYQTDSWEDYLVSWLAGRQKFLLSEALEDALFIRVERHDRSVQTRVGAILRRLGWVVKQETTGARKRYYVRKGCSL